VKIAVIGGAGVRTPLLVSGFARSDLPLSEIALFDVDRTKLDVIAALSARVAGRVEVTRHDSLARCLAGARFVFTSIRSGGANTRARDERAALDLGVIGQETVGAAGFAMAMRNVPALAAYVPEILRHAPDAWVVNFTNPVGIVTEALHREGCHRVIGICDTPTELFEEVAHALGCASTECDFDYLGLNHLGWLREVRVNGTPRLGELWRRPEALARLYRVPIFDGDFLAALRLLPTEYLVYYYRTEQVLANLCTAGHSRGAIVAALTAELLDDLPKSANPVSRYEAYLAARSATYMQIESGTASPVPRSPWAELTGYDRIALAVIRAIHFATGAIIPLNVLNRGAIVDLQDDDVVEVPCTVSSNGARPLAAGRAPSSQRDLLLAVKAFERATVRAARSRRRDDALDALASNPLVPRRDLAERLLSAFALP
jgi:6-phospho-beta-glucosidase